MGRYTSVSILTTMHKEITELIFQKQWLGYRSVAEFARSALRRELERCKREVSSQRITEWKE